MAQMRDVPPMKMQVSLPYLSCFSRMVSAVVLYASSQVMRSHAGSSPFAPVRRSG